MVGAKDCAARFWIRNVLSERQPCRSALGGNKVADLAQMPATVERRQGNVRKRPEWSFLARGPLRRIHPLFASLASTSARVCAWSLILFAPTANRHILLRKMARIHPPL